MTENGVGGYFELELPKAKLFLYPQSLKFQSARASFLALLRAGKPKRVWMPHYICDSMLAPLRYTGVEVTFYSINTQFDIVDKFELPANDWLFYVNYFGVCSQNIDRIMSRFYKNQVVLDYSQSFYAAPRECLANIYSPRKFFGVPDGGLLITNLLIAIPSEIESGSVVRSTHLLKRLAVSAESGYADYQQAELSLVEFEPHQMSSLTRRILNSVDFEAVRTRRNNNFHFLHKRLGKINKLLIDPLSINGPLCYPFFIAKAGIRQRLIRERIFVATYWPDVLDRVDDSSCEASLVKNIIPLPCDQRYGKEEMKKIIDICSEFCLE